MPPSFCLIPKYADELRERIASGKLNLAELAKMSSEDRHAALAEVVGEANAEHVNAAFESKLLLENQKKGLETWVRQATEGKPELRRDLLARVQRMDRVLQPEDRAGFLADLAKQKLGFGVTMDEAGKITELAKAVSDARTANDWERYLDARMAFREYVDPLRTPAKGLSPADYVRAGALSSPKVFAKLSLVALSRMATTPLEDAVAVGVRRAMPRLAEGAGRYDVGADEAVKAEAAAHAAMWTDGMIDAGRLLKNKASRLDLQFGGDNAVAHKWYEYFGSLHAAIKEPIKRAEFARSLYRRTAAAAANGEDVNNIAVKMRLATEAYKDGQRAISMQDNVVTSAWNSGLRRLEQPDKETGKPSPVGKFLSTALRADTPVMKAPANIVAEANDYIFGSLAGPGRAAWSYFKGVEDLKPVERDAIIRQISKGAVGAAIMTLAYFKRDQVKFGGFYQAGEKRKASDVPEGALRIGDVTVPKQLMEHPIFQAANFAASMGRMVDRQHATDASGLMNTAAAAEFGLLDEVPVIHTAEDATRLVHEEGTKDGLGELASQKTADLATPQIVQWAAKATDDAPKRAPTGLAEHIEADLPGLRENVPTKKRKAKRR